MIAHESATILALMSGTSVDTIDAAICRINPNVAGRLGCSVLAFHEHEVPVRLRQRIFEAFADGEHSLSLACSLNFEIGEAFAQAANEAIRIWDGNRNEIAAIASHGQTLYHIAPHMAVNDPERWVASTLQLGEPAVIAQRTGLAVISNFRVADMAAGGNGAPLVPFADFHLFSQEGRGVVVHNLGGIANCTWLPPEGSADGVIAFDTGPANMIMDALVGHYYPGEKFDRNGDHARAGRLIADLLAEWMSIPYISAAPPKSTGRELFGEQLVRRSLAEYPDSAADDFIATATEFTALSLAVNLEKFVMPRGRIDQLILAGGGAQNPFLVGRIRHHLAAQIPSIVTLDELNLGISSKSRECAGFALMGYAHLVGMPANLPAVTGARHATVLGQLTPAQ